MTSGAIQGFKGGTGESEDVVNNPLLILPRIKPFSSTVKHATIATRKKANWETFDNCVSKVASFGSGHAIALSFTKFLHSFVLPQIGLKNFTLVMNLFGFKMSYERKWSDSHLKVK